MSAGDFTFSNTAETNSDTNSAGTETTDGTDEYEVIEYDLSENVVRDLVEYTRSKTVKNEQQFVLTVLPYISGLMADPSDYVCYVLIGTAGAGKSHLQNTVEELFEEAKGGDYMYKATSGTDKSIIYDETLDVAIFASLDELQKPSEELIEILKSLHGGQDEEFRYKVTGGGRGADRDVDEIVKDALPYGFLYAQYEPDFEMWDRLLKIPVHESKEKNDGVARSQWDHSMVSFGDSEHEYLFDFSEGERALKKHIDQLPTDVRVKIPAGEGEFGWDAYRFAKPLFDISRSETNRVSGQIANLVRASTLLNHQNRERRMVHIENEGRKEVLIAEPQDLANILSCREVLLATTHQLDRKRKAICLALDEVGGTDRTAPIKHPKDREGEPKSIMGYLRKTNASFVKRPEIEAMLEDLQDNGLVEELPGAGQSNRTVYQFQSWQQLGKFQIDDEFKRVFGDCTDPFRDQPFVQTARELNDELTPSASEFMSEATVETESTGQQSLDPTPSGVDLQPHEELVAEMAHDALDGEVIEHLDEREPSLREMIGLVDLGDDDDALGDTSGTILDPTHEVWSHGPDEWVTSVGEAEQEVEAALQTITNEGIFRTNVIEARGDQPLTMEVSVDELD